MGNNRDTAAERLQDDPIFSEYKKIGGDQKILENVHREYLKTGDAKYVLEALKWSCFFRSVVPDWAARAFFIALEDVDNLRVGSWDDVFGKPVKKRMRLAAARRRLELEPDVYFAITKILDEKPGTPIDTLLFEEVGEQLNIGATLVGELWAKNRFRYFHRRDKHRVKSS